MDLAWRLLKAPYDVFTQEGHAKEPFEGTLYAGGDVADTPRYYTPSLEGALDYAVYGSATGDVPMRGTSPAIRVVQDPGFDEKGQPAGRLIADSQLGDAYMQDDDSPLQSELMDDDTLRQLISQMSDKSPRIDTTGYYHSQQDREKHIQGALERLKNKKGGRLDLTDSEKQIGGISTGRHDELDAMDFDDINSGWDFLEDWEKSWLLDNRFDELPMWVQEQYQDDVKTGEPMDIAKRLLKFQTTLPQFDPELSEETGYVGVPPVQQYHSATLPDAMKFMTGTQDPHQRMWTEEEPERARRWARGMTQGGPGGAIVGVRGKSPRGERLSPDWSNQPATEMDALTIPGAELSPQDIVMQPLPTPPSARSMRPRYSDKQIADEKARQQAAYSKFREYLFDPNISEEEKGAALEDIDARFNLNEMISDDPSFRYNPTTNAWELEE